MQPIGVFTGLCSGTSFVCSYAKVCAVFYVFIHVFLFYFILLENLEFCVFITFPLLSSLPDCLAEIKTLFTCHFLKLLLCSSTDWVSSLTLVCHLKLILTVQHIYSNQSI